MSELAFQVALAKLLTNERLRISFYEGNEQWLQEHALADSEIARLRALCEGDRRRLELHSQLLGTKRKRKLEISFRGLKQIVGNESWNQICEGFFGQLPLEAQLDSYEDALIFGDFIRRFLVRPECVALLDYHLFRISFSTMVIDSPSESTGTTQIGLGCEEDLLRSFLIVKHPYRYQEFPYDVLALAQLSSSSQMKDDWRHQTCVLLYRDCYTNWVRASRVGRGIIVLLELCKGHISGREIVNTCSHDVRVQRKAASALTSMVRAGAIRLLPLPVSGQEAR